MRKAFLAVLLIAIGAMGDDILSSAEVKPASSLPADHTIKSVTVFRFDKAQGVEFGKGINRRHLHGQHGTLAVFELKKGAIVPLHQHPNEQITYIVEGLVEVTAGGRKYRVGAGEVIVLPPNVPHEFLALEDTTDIDFFSPARADWQRGADSYLRGDSKTK